VGLHASFTVGERTLGRAVDMMKRYNTGIHIHVAEDAYDQGQSLNKHGRRVIERLEKAGVLSSLKTLLVHCLHLEANERELIRNSPAWVVQNCESNLNNNVGYFNGTGLGENIMLGTDGMHSDMLQSGDGDNNLVILDYDSPTPVSRENFFGHFLFGITSNHITDVISNGRFVMKDRKITTVDENEIFMESRQQAERLWSKMQQNS
jgi:cytosine/adenosine deaminase-related metal-dependent hydrolase